ncbi:MAG: type VI secretion system tip protein TssI/VgrG [Minicystis sp.]
MTTNSLPPYQLAIDGFPREHFRVQAFAGKETISEVYSFEIVVTCESDGEEVERAGLGQRAVLLFNVGEVQRAFYGVVASVRLVQVHAVDHRIKYHVRLVPRLWLLKRRKRTRIFQNMRVPDIVAAVLNEAGIATRWQLTRAYPMREYCTQYEETDYRFVKRLLAEAGIYFYFPEGPPVDDAALAADSAIGAAVAAGSTVLDAVGASAVGSLVGQAASLAETLIPGDTVICADDASCYPPMNGDDAAALAASTAAALAPTVGDLLGAGDGIAGAAVGTASAVASTVIAAATEGSREVPVLHFLANEDARVSVLDKVTRFTLRNTVRSTGAVFRDYDPDRPMVRLQSSAVSTQPFPPSPFEEAAAALAAAENVASIAQSLVPLPSGAGGAIAAFESVAETADAAVNAAAGALGQKVPHEVYEHHSPFLFPKWGFANDEAPRILRQKRRRASIAAGEGGCSDLSPGHRFALHAHPAPQMDGTYVVISAEHRGETHPESGGIWRVYRNTFECAPVAMPYPPSRPKRKSVQVSLTATVVGPPGEEIWVDEKGQIKVQFHWDREGRYDDKSSCWIRVMQPWAGAGWGHQFIPRVGMEVVVVFEGGDPDKPMVLGSVYNGTHPPPFKLPQEKTRSGIRTSSTPGGHGHNELSFNDAAGSEEIFVHAQRNYAEVVEKDRSSRVMGHARIDVALGASEHIGVDLALDVDGRRDTSIGGDDRLNVGGRSSAHVRGDQNVEVAGNSATTVMGTHSLEARRDRVLVVGTSEQPANSDHLVYGSGSFSAEDRLFLRAKNGIVLEVGETTVEITPDKIVLRGSEIELLPKKSLSASSGGGPSMTMGEEVEILSKKLKIFTESGALELDKEFKVKGNKIQLGYDPSKPSRDTKDQKPETKSFSVKFSDYFFQPYASKKYHLMVEGLRFEGETDAEGMAKQDIPKDAKQVVVRLWIDEYPEGRQRLYVLRLGEIPPSSTVAGVKHRLKNLGYYHGPIDDAPSEDLAAGVAEFQDDHRDTHALEPTGEADAATAGALEDVHGS